MKYLLVCFMFLAALALQAQNLAVFDESGLSLAIPYEDISIVIERPSGGAIVRREKREEDFLTNRSVSDIVDSSGCTLIQFTDRLESRQVAINVNNIQLLDAQSSGKGFFVTRRPTEERYYANENYSDIIVDLDSCILLNGGANGLGGLNIDSLIQILSNGGGDTTIIIPPDTITLDDTTIIYPGDTLVFNVENDAFLEYRHVAFGDSLNRITWNPNLFQYYTRPDNRLELKGLGSLQDGPMLDLYQNKFGYPQILIGSHKVNGFAKFSNIAGYTKNNNWVGIVGHASGLTPEVNYVTIGGKINGSANSGNVVFPDDIRMYVKGTTISSDNEGAVLRDPGYWHWWEYPTKPYTSLSEIAGFIIVEDNGEIGRAPLNTSRGDPGTDTIYVFDIDTLYNFDTIFVIDQNGDTTFIVNNDTLYLTQDTITIVVNNGDTTFLQDDHVAFGSDDNRVTWNPQLFRYYDRLDNDFNNTLELKGLKSLQTDPLLQMFDSDFDIPHLMIASSDKNGDFKSANITTLTQSGKTMTLMSSKSLAGYNYVVYGYGNLNGGTQERAPSWYDWYTSNNNANEAIAMRLQHNQYDNTGNLLLFNYPGFNYTDPNAASYNGYLGIMANGRVVKVHPDSVGSGGGSAYSWFISDNTTVTEVLNGDTVVVLGSNIYTDSDTLEENRIVYGDNKTLTFDSTSTFTVTADGAATSDIDLQASDDVTVTAGDQISLEVQNNARRWVLEDDAYWNYLSDGANLVFLNGSMTNRDITGVSNFFFLGSSIGGVNTITGDHNYIFGYQAARLLSSGDNNFVAGNEALELNQTGDDNIAIGLRAGENVTGTGNIMLGKLAGENSTAVNHNVLIGHEVGQPTSNQNVFLGYNAGRSAGSVSVTGGGNFVSGFRALGNNSSAQHNTFIGEFAGSTSNGNENVGLGRSVMENATLTDYAVAIGSEAGDKLVGADEGVFIGRQSALFTSDAIRSVFVGYQSGEGFNSEAASTPLFYGPESGARARGIDPAIFGASWTQEAGQDSFTITAVDFANEKFYVPAHGLTVGQHYTARFTTSGTLPSPLSVGQYYQVFTTTADTIEMTLVNLTNAGTGTHKIRIPGRLDYVSIFGNDIEPTADSTAYIGTSGSQPYAVFGPTALVIDDATKVPSSSADELPQYPVGTIVFKADTMYRKVSGTNPFWKREVFESW